MAISVICVTLVSLRDSLTARLSCDVWTGCSVQFVYVIVQQEWEVLWCWLVPGFIAFLSGRVVFEGFIQVFCEHK